MKTISKVGLVGGGYVASFLIASVVTAIYVAATSSPDRETYGAMYAFGDSLLFLAVFAVAAALPTGAWLYFLRSYRAFWPPLSITAGVIALTGIAACAYFLVARTMGPAAAIQEWSGPAVLRILLAPLSALAFFLCGLFSPIRASRIALFGAATCEAAIFGIWFMCLQMTRY